MKLLSTYYDDEMKKESNVFLVNDKEYRVTVKSDTGTTYSTYFKDEQAAENFAENWVMLK
jgi:hypothetical protein